MDSKSRLFVTIPSLQRLPFLRKFELRDMLNVTEVSIPSLEELLLDEMPKLERCSCTSLRDLNSSLRVLKVTGCPVLKVFPLFEDCQKFKIEQKSWLSSLEELIIHECPRLLVPHPLPPSTSVSKLSISRVSTLPTMVGSSSGTLTIGLWRCVGLNEVLIDEPSDELRTLDGKMLSFHNLRFLTHLRIASCRNLTSISFKGLRQLISLKSLEIHGCTKLFSSHVLPEDTYEDTAAANCNTLPYLERLRIVSCGITGKWLSLMLRHVQALEELILEECKEIAWLSVEEEEENSISNLISSPQYSSDGPLCIHLNLISSLEKICIGNCGDIKCYGSKDVFAGFTSLELEIWGCPELLTSLVHEDGRWLLPQSLVELFIRYTPETLQPCFPGNLTCLKKLEVCRSSSLESLRLHSCTALEELKIQECGSLAALEGLQSLGGLRRLKVYNCPGLRLESLQVHSCTTLEDLAIRDCGSLAALEGLQSPGGLRRLEEWPSPSLKSLKLHSCTALEEWLASPEGLQSLGNLKALKIYRNRSLESLRLHSCTALEELKIRECGSLAALEGLQSLGGLRHLEVYDCPGLSLSSQGYELCPRLERLRVDDPSALTTSFCKHLTSLQHLGLYGISTSRDVMSQRLTDEQEEALQLLTSLQELEFCCFDDLPAGLHSLRSLKRLVISCHNRFSRLPAKGLPPSLEQLDIIFCSKELKEQCRMLATSKLKVRIDSKYVN